jgi:hypothetical protein
MKKILVVNKNLEPFDVYIGRGSPFGNPFPVHNGEFTLEESLHLYEHYLFDKIMTESDFKSKFLQLEGKKLGCFCKKARSDSEEYKNDRTPCHGDVIVKLIERFSK